MFSFISSHPQIFLIIALVVFILLLGWVIYLTLIFKAYLKGKRQLIKAIRRRGIEHLLEGQATRIKKLDLDVKELYDITDEISKLATLSITKVGVVRYNPFSEVGGDQSFSIALLNRNLDGLVISSLHGREGTRIYSKPIKKGQSEYQLSKEEKEAIQRAQMEKD